MPRCVAARLPGIAVASAALVLAALLLPAPGVAQTDSRPFPAQALRGELHIEQPPAVRLNGQPARLAPGARIRGTDNMLKLPAALAGQTLTVHYTVDTYGLLMDIWVLTPEERRIRPWPRTRAEAAAWTFDPLAHRWSRR
jgi:hypothetical protein